EARNLLLGTALLGEIGADATEAEKTATLVEDWVARQRPMDVLLARRAHDHVGEGEAGRQMEAERLALFDGIGDVGIDRKEVGELSAEQLARVALEIFRELPRDIGQSPERIGFPEPSAAAVPEFIDTMERLLRLPFDGQAPSSPGDRLARVRDAV